MRIYMDNCCYNRPYDDQSQIRISLETQAKLYVQDMVKRGQVELATSYVLWYENSENPYEIKRIAIGNFIQENSKQHLDIDKAELVKSKAEKIMETGIKIKDAYHVACALFLECDCFLTTDDRLLKYSTENMRIINPIDFVKGFKEEFDDE